MTTWAVIRTDTADVHRVGASDPTEAAQTAASGTWMLPRDDVKRVQTDGSDGRWHEYLHPRSGVTIYVRQETRHRERRRT